MPFVEVDIDAIIEEEKAKDLEFYNSLVEGYQDYEPVSEESLFVNQDVRIINGTFKGIKGLLIGANYLARSVTVRISRGHYDVDLPWEFVKQDK